MKKFIPLILLLLPSFISAQTIGWGAGKKAKVDSISKRIVDKSKYIVLYQFIFAENAKKPENKNFSETLLEIGKRYNRFVDFNKLRFDAIIDSCAYGKIDLGKATPSMMQTLRLAKFKQSILIDNKKNTILIQRSAGSSKDIYQYKEPTHKFDWKLEEGEQDILGYKCKKAVTDFRGRTWTAWYATDIDLPYGPYVFSGLPGLILKVEDSEDNFRFTASALEEADMYLPIYYLTKDNIIKTSRKKVRKIYKNACKDPAAALLSAGNITLPEETRASIKQRPYNPIELE